MQDYITSAGQAVIAANQLSRIQTFKLGSTSNYTPGISDTDIHGSNVHSGSITSVELLTPGLVKITIILGATLGPFNYGEVGVFLDDASLFSLSAFDSLQTKAPAVTDPDGQAYAVELLINFVSGGVTTLSTGTTYDKTLMLPSYLELPDPVEASNVYLIPDPDSPYETILCYAYTTNWSMSGYRRLSPHIISTAATSSSVTLPGSAYTYTTGQFIQFVDGINRGKIRRVFSITAVGPNTRYNLDSPLLYPSGVEDSVVFYDRFVGPTTALQNPSNAILSMGGYKITNLGAPATGTDAATKTYVDASAIAINGSNTPSADISWGGRKLTNLGTPTTGTDAVTKNYVDAAVVVAGDGFASGASPATGNVDLGSFRLVALGTPVAGTDAATKTYVDTADAGKLSLTGGTMSGAIAMSTAKITGLGNATVGTDALNKQTADATYSVLAHVHVDATTGTAGFMTAAQVTKLNGVATGATANATDAALRDRATHTGTQLSTTISDFNTAVDARIGALGGGDVLADGSVPFTGNINAGGHKVIGLAAPTTGTDATTKTYVDNAIAGAIPGGDIKSDGTVAFANNQSMGGNRITSLGTPSVGTDATTKTYVDSAAALKLDLAGGTLTGNLAMSNNRVTGLSSPSVSGDAATKGYVDAVAANYLPLAGGTLTGLLNMSNTKIQSLATPTVSTDAATKGYVDSAISASGGGDVLSNGSVPFTGHVNMSSFRLTNLGAPSTGTDAATKTYVDTIVSGGILHFYDDVRVCATGNVTLSAPGATLDGVTMVSGDRFLAPIQTTATASGIYIWNGAASAATRATDMDATGELYTGRLIKVREGTALGDTIWMYVTEGATLGATSLIFKRMDPYGPAVADRDMAGFRITNLATPSTAGDATSKSYVDGSNRVYEPVRLASTANLTISAPGSTIDGVTPTNGDRILLKNQTTGHENGLYVYNGSGSAMTRADGMTTGTEVVPGKMVMVKEGQRNADSLWSVTNDGTVLLNTTSITFRQISIGYSSPRIYTNETATGSITLDFSLYDEFRLTLTGNVTLTFSGAPDGHRSIIKIKQDGTGGRTVGLPGTVRYNAAVTSYTASTAASAIDRVGFIYDGADLKYDLTALAQQIA